MDKLTPEPWRNLPSTVSVIKGAYEDSSAHQQAQIRAYITNLPENVGITDSDRLKWIFDNCNVVTVASEKVNGGMDIRRKTQIDFQLKKKTK